MIRSIRMNESHAKDCGFVKRITQLEFDELKKGILVAVLAVGVRSRFNKNLTALVTQQVDTPSQEQDLCEARSD